MKESRVISIILACVVLVVLSMSCLNTDDKIYLLYKQDVTLKYGHFGLAPEGTTFTVLPNDVFKNEDITSLRKRTGTSERYGLVTELRAKSFNFQNIRISQSIFDELKEKGKEYIIENTPNTKALDKMADDYPQTILLNDELKKFNYRFLGHLVVHNLKLKLNDDFDELIRSKAALPDKVQILSTIQQDAMYSVLIGVQDTSGLSMVNGNEQAWTDINTLTNLHLSLVP